MLDSSVKKQFNKKAVVMKIFERAPLLILTLIVHNNLSAMLTSARSVAQTIRSVSVTQQMRTLTENCAPLLNYDTHKAHIEQLEAAAESDNLREVETVCRKMDLHPCRALHKAKSIRVVDALLKAGLDINAANPTTPLHEVPNELIPHLLRKGADAGIEDQAKPDFVLGSYLNKEIGYIVNNFGGHQEYWFENSNSKWFKANEIDCLKIFPGELQKHCHWYRQAQERGGFVKTISLHTSAPAWAAQCADVARFNIFLRHVASWVMLPQIPKIFFITRLMPLFRPDKKESYQTIQDMLTERIKTSAITSEAMCRE